MDSPNAIGLGMQIAKVLPAVIGVLAVLTAAGVSTLVWAGRWVCRAVCDEDGCCDA